MSQTSLYFAKLKSVIDAIDAPAFDRGIAMIREAWEAGRQIIVFGNGGSAHTASHFITDMNKMTFLRTGRPFRGLCLNDNIGLITAYANDISYSEIFVQQLKSVLQAGDLVLAISGSGNSPNIVRAVEHANAAGAVTLGLCGYDGGKLKRLAHHSAHVPIDDMQISEDLHLVFVHATLRSLTAPL